MDKNKQIDFSLLWANNSEKAHSGDLGSTFFDKDVFENETIPYTDLKFLFDTKLYSHIQNYDSWDPKLNIGNTTKKNELNELNFRSNNFKNFHNKKHIVFTGCSNTWGMGLKQEETWPLQVYNKIKENEDISGYYNLGIPGTGIPSQVINLFKYFKTYGNPDVIFYNMPDLLRSYSWNNKKLKYYDAFYTDKNTELLDLFAFQYYFMLNHYCESHNIKLFSFTWVDNGVRHQNPWDFHFKNLGFLDYFDSFYSIKKDELIEFIVDYKNKNKNDKFADIARDKQHPGTAYHEYWSNFIYEKYKKSL
jgi:hypothetical protein